MTESWKPDYIPEIFPYSNVEFIETWRWKTYFRFKIGKNLSRKSRKTYVFDDLSGCTYEDRDDIHFLTQDKELDWKIIRICNKYKFLHGVMWEGEEKGWYHVIIRSHRLVHKVIRALQSHGIQATLQSPNRYFVTQS